MTARVERRGMTAGDECEGEGVTAGAGRGLIEDLVEGARLTPVTKRRVLLGKNCSRREGQEGRKGREG